MLSNLVELKASSGNKNDLATKDELSLLSDEIKILMQQHSDATEHHEQTDKDVAKLKIDLS